MTARRWWGWPLVPVYWAAVRAKDGLRALGVLRVQRLRWPVVSVGSLSAGGAGKTPVVICLAEMLTARGWAVDVLSRGYGRSGRGVERVDGDAEGAAGRFGDEPVLLARRAGVPVFVGADRFAAGRAAEAAGGGAKDAGRGVHLLDDGMQHRRLARAVEIVLVTAEDLEDALLPAGNRREPLRALGRADAVVLREEELLQVEGWMRQDAALWRVRRELTFPAPLGVLSAGLRPMAFCAIARPEGFQEMMREAGCGVVETMAFDDHHAYVAGDMDRIVEVAKGCGATGFFTTEKDRVKLDGGMVERLEALGPVCVVTLTAQFVDEAAVVRELEARLR